MELQPHGKQNFMHIRSLRFFAVAQASLSLILAGMPAKAQSQASRADKNQAINITYGKVTGVDQVKLDSAAGGGAVVGGMVGLASQRGSSRVGGAVAGAALGSILTRAAEGSRKADAFTVQKNDGSTIRVIQDMADIRVGDCVVVEQGSTANIRRASDEMCVSGPHQTDSMVAASYQHDAGECEQAKQAVLNANSDAEFTRAEKKVKILCD
jgi:outer membrane lipoprotein SlyB